MLDFNLHPYIIVDSRDRGDLHLTINKNNNSAFTLIELMIVIAIMAILSAIAIPNFQTYMAQKRLSGAARMVMSDLMNARMLAVTLNRNVQVTFPTSASDSYTYDATGTSPITKNIKTGFGYHDVTLFSNTNPVFIPNGTVFYFTNGTVTLSNGAGSKQVKTSSAGRVAIY